MSLLSNISCFLFFSSIKCSQLATNDVDSSRNTERYWLLSDGFLTYSILLLYQSITMTEKSNIQRIKFHVIAIRWASFLNDIQQKHKYVDKIEWILLNLLLLIVFMINHDKWRTINVYRALEISRLLLLCRLIQIDWNSKLNWTHRIGASTHCGITGIDSWKIRKLRLTFNWYILAISSNTIGNGPKQCKYE